MHKVPQFRDQFFGDETIFAQGKNVPTLSILRRSNSGEKCVSENCVTNYWELTSSVKAVLPAPLHYRHLTPTRLQAEGSLMGKGYETVLPLSEDCRKDLQGGSIKCPHGMVAQ